MEILITFQEMTEMRMELLIPVMLMTNPKKDPRRVIWEKIQLKKMRKMGKTQKTTV
jgi:hypothetical protein